MEQKNYLHAHLQPNGIHLMELPKLSSQLWDKSKTPLTALESVIQEPCPSLMTQLKYKYSKTMLIEMEAASKKLLISQKRDGFQLLDYLQDCWLFYSSQLSSYAASAIMTN